MGETYTIISLNLYQYFSTKIIPFQEKKKVPIKAAIFNFFFNLMAHIN